MPRRSLLPSVPSRTETGSLPSPTAPPEQATQLLTHAHALLAQVTEERHALEQCVAVLQHAPAAACFFYHPDPPALVPASGRRNGGRTATTLHAQLTATLHQIPAQMETIRLNTLFALSRLGIPIALWHFLIPGPLPTTVAALTPAGVRGPAPTGHSPPVPDPYAPLLVVTPTD
jgi:hypothetical protein